MNNRTSPSGHLLVRPVAWLSNALHRVWDQRYALFLSLLLLLGLGVRLYRINIPLLEYVPIKQIETAMVARNLYERGYQILRPQAFDPETNAFFVHEFPLYNLAVALSYEVTGVQEVNGRILSVLFWLLAAYLLYKLAARHADQTAGLFAAFVFLLLPLGVQISRSFQHESLMILLSIAAIYFFYVWAEEQKTLSLYGGLACLSLAFLVKAPAIIQVALPCLVLLVVREPGETRPKPFPFVLGLGVLALLPGVAWYTYGFQAASLRGWASSGFQPHLLLTRDYYYGVRDLMINALTPVGLILMVLGAFLRVKSRRGMFLHAWLLGVMVYLATFNYHAMTHDYYHVPWLPVASIFIGMSLAMVWRSRLFTQSFAPGAARVLVVALLVYLSYLSLRYGHAEIFADKTSEVQTYQAISELLGPGNDPILIHSTPYGFVALYYMHRLGYEFPSMMHWDWGARWLGRTRPDMVELFESYRRRGAKYFVSTRPEDLAGAGSLLQHLQANYRLISDPQADYLVYDIH